MPQLILPPKTFMYYFSQGLRGFRVAELHPQEFLLEPPRVEDMDSYKRFRLFWSLNELLPLTVWREYIVDGHWNKGEKILELQPEEIRDTTELEERLRSLVAVNTFGFSGRVGR